MPVTPAPKPARRSPRRLRLDALEDRAVPTTVPEIEANNTQATAQLVSIATSDVLTTAADDWLTIDGSVASNSDWDYYQFTLAANAGVFFDVDSRDTGLSTTLDSQLNLFTAAGVELANNNDGYDFEGFAVPLTSTGGGTSRDSSLYADLGPGTYAVRVRSFNGTTSGAYHLRLLADSGYPTTVPVFHSLPGAADTLYLDFDGHSATDSWGTYTAAPYDLDGNPGRYTPAERLAIRNIWRVAAEDYSPFNIDITTATPGTIANGVGHRHIVTGSDGSIINEAGSLGIAFLNSYAGGAPSSDNVSFSFVPEFDTYSGGGLSGEIMATPVEVGSNAAHEFGHALGLDHYKSEAAPGAGSVIPSAIMATPDLGLNREVWTTGTNTSGANQDDMAVISRTVNTFGYRADDHGNTTATATVLTASAGLYTATGRIERTTDPDVFRFMATGPTTVTVDVDEYVNDLDAVLRLFDSTGAQIAIDNPAGSFDATVTLTLAAGTYYADVRGTGAAGVAGQYSLRITTTVAEPPALSGIESAPLAYAENQTLAVTDALVVADPDSALLSGATVSITGNFVAGQDTLVFTDQNGITGSFSGSTLTLSGAATVANYQAALRSVRYRNTSDSPSTATRTITFRVTDPTGLSSDPVSRTVTVTAVNDAPVLDNTGSMTLGSILEDAVANAGTLVTGLLASAGGDRVTDPDAGAVEGIAVTATAGNGTWQFSTDDGGSWADLGAVTPTAARLLAADAQTRIRFVPAANFTGTLDPAVTFRAWDRTTGVNGGTADTSTNGGATAFSTATETASLTVTPVNDTPSFNKGANQTVSVDAGPQTVAGWATAISPGPADEAGQGLTFLVSTNNNALFAALPAVNPVTGDLTFTPAAGAIGVATLTVRLKDDGGTANGGADTSAAQTFTIVVNPDGNAPFPVADEVSTTDQQPVTVDVLANDVDPNGDPLTLVSVSAGALGTATVVNNQVRYVPRANAHGDDVLTYTVRDPDGNTAAGILTVHVTDVTDPTVKQVRLYYGNGRYELLTSRIAVYSWSNIRRIQLVFSEDVSVQQNDLSLTGGNVANYLFTGFSYNATTFTATWTRTAAIGIDRLRLTLDGTTAGGVKDAAGNLLGADVVRQFAVLPGDLDGDGLVTLAEANTVRRNIGRRYPTPRTADVNGDGLVTRTDYFIARANIGRRI